MESKVITVKDRPTQCPKCGGRVVVNTEGDPQWACVHCGVKFREK